MCFADFPYGKTGFVTTLDATHINVHAYVNYERTVHLQSD